MAIYNVRGITYLVDVSLLDLGPASYFFAGIPFAAEESPHGFDVTAVIWSARGLGAAKGEYGVESFFPVGTVQQIFF